MVSPDRYPEGLSTGCVCRVGVELTELFDSLFDVGATEPYC